MENILLVDDSRLVRGSFKRFLKLLSYDINIFEAADGKSALELWEANKPDIIILDLIIPEPIGEEVLKIIRKTDNKSFIAVLSSNFQAPVKRRVLRNGANLFIEKPLSPEKVKEVMLNYKIHQKEA